MNLARYVRVLVCACIPPLSCPSGPADSVSSVRPALHRPPPPPSTSPVVQVFVLVSVAPLLVKLCLLLNDVRHLPVRRATQTDMEMRRRRKCHSSRAKAEHSKTFLGDRTAQTVCNSPDSPQSASSLRSTREAPPHVLLTSHCIFIWLLCRQMDDAKALKEQQKSMRASKRCAEVSVAFCVALPCCF